MYMNCRTISGGAHGTGPQLSQFVRLIRGIYTTEHPVNVGNGNVDLLLFGRHSLPTGTRSIFFLELKLPVRFSRLPTAHGPAFDDRQVATYDVRSQKYHRPECQLGTYEINALKASG